MPLRMNISNNMMVSYVLRTANCEHFVSYFMFYVIIIIPNLTFTLQNTIHY